MGSWGEEADREPFYSVWEQTPKKAKKRSEAHSLAHIVLEWGDSDEDVRDPALRLDIESVVIHHVEAASFETISFKVRRHRSERMEPTMDWTLPE